MLNWSALDTHIAEAERVVLTTHVRPDGDALGSELAMADLLLQKGKQVEIFNASPTPARYRFLDPAGDRIGVLGFADSPPRAPSLRPDLFIVLDTGTWSQLAGLADYVRGLDIPKVVIDHHVSQDDLGALRLVDVSASACGMLVYHAFEQLGVELTPTAVDALFVAIATDTGWMRHSNTTPEVLATLGKLVQLGAKPHELYQQLYETNSLARMKLLGRLLERLRLESDGKVVLGEVTLADIAQASAHPMDTEDFIGYLMGIRDVETAVLFIEQMDGGAKISFRSRTLDCASLAEQFGGGGHRPAAGATLRQSLAQSVAMVVPAVVEATNAFAAEN